MQATGNADLRFGYWYVVPSPSSMTLGIRVLIDGAQGAITQGTVQGGSKTFSATLSGVAPGFHVIDVEVRSRLLQGPPSSFHVWAGPSSGGPAALTVTVR